MLDVCIVIPAKNEQRALGSVLATIPSGCRVIVVDDGSEDQTKAVAMAYDAITLGLPRSHGAGHATWVGLYAAINYRVPDILVTMDADGQHSTSDIPLLLQKLESRSRLTYETFDRYDLVIGSRQVGWRRGRILASWLFNALTGVPLRADSQSGFKAMNSKAAKILGQTLSSNSFAFCSEILILSKKHGLKVGWVPVKELNTSYSLSKPGRQRWFHVPRLCWEIIKLRFKHQCFY